MQRLAKTLIAKGWACLLDWSLMHLIKKNIILHCAVTQDQFSASARSRESIPYKLGTIYFRGKVQRNLSIAQLVSIENHFTVLHVLLACS